LINLPRPPKKDPPQLIPLPLNPHSPRLPLLPSPPLPAAAGGATPLEHSTLWSVVGLAGEKTTRPPAPLTVGMELPVGQYTISLIDFVRAGATMLVMFVGPIHGGARHPVARCHSQQSPVPTS
jgi:hypothetical protein